MKATTAGYREIEHTADWELEVWAPDLMGLMQQAALGMYQLMGVQVSGLQAETRALKCTAPDNESLLVSFLSELLYYCDMEGIVFQEFNFSKDDEGLSVEMTGLPLHSIDKEIKAVTYHNLKVENTGSGYQVRIVFDV
jgi:SHS2 domain-containing protein